MKKLFLIFIIFLFSCSKDKVDPSIGPGTLEFDNVFTSDLDLAIDYSVSEIKLKRDDGSLYDDGLKSYHVTEADEGSQEVSLKDLPAGNYTQISFTIQSLNVTGSFEYHNAAATVSLTMPDTGVPVRPGHEPEVHMLFDMNKLKDGNDIQGSFVVDHIHAN